jgi:hypothetical protein
MTVDKLLWIVAFICFMIVFLRGLFGGNTADRGPWYGRFDLISLGLAAWVLTNLI